MWSFIGSNAAASGSMFNEDLIKENDAFVFLWGSVDLRDIIDGTRAKSEIVGDNAELNNQISKFEGRDSWNEKLELK